VKQPLRLSLYILLVVFMLLTFYAIFNAGNPNSIFRVVVADPAYDFALTVGLSLVVAVLVLLLSSGRRQSELERLLEMNKEHIRELRVKGKSEEAIADSFLASLQSGRKGVLYSLARRRVLRYLGRIE
jgi:hypothetical protein